MSRSKDMKVTYQQAAIARLEKHKMLLAGLPRGQRQRLTKRINNVIRQKEAKTC